MPFILKFKNPKINDRTIVDSRTTVKRKINVEEESAKLYNMIQHSSLDEINYTEALKLAKKIHEATKGHRITTNNGSTLLHKAARFGKLEILRELSKINKDTYRDKKENLALHDAAMQLRNEEAIKILLENNQYDKKDLIKAYESSTGKARETIKQFLQPR